MFESVCLKCNPISRKKDTQQDGVARGREGVYVGETCRSLHERGIEHHNDARGFFQKSHQVKHWMISHPEEPIQPPFSIKILKRYREYLSRQIGEIYYSNDHLINSKSEYVQNCISRISVCEETWERKEK